MEENIQILEEGSISIPGVSDQSGIMSWWLPFIGAGGDVREGGGDVGDRGGGEDWYYKECRHSRRAPSGEHREYIGPI